ncbi:MAG: carboxypeptidase M32 [Clostridium sp.]|uniref:carboxypeptidase M32 n=1 Tax=Clostridium sp. TaxID=1506 RepID=UPI00303B3247
MTKGNKIYETKLVEFKEMVRKIEYLKYTLNSLVYWDKITNMPEKGIGYRSEVMSYLGGELYKLFSDKKLRTYVNYFEGKKENEKYVDSMIKRIKRNYSYVSSIPAKEYTQYITLIAKAEGEWEKAKTQKDFNIFAPHLEKIVEAFKSFAECWGYDENPYDALMGYYEDGATVGQIDRMATELRDFVIDLLGKIKTDGKNIEDSLFNKDINISKATQKELSEKLLEEIGFDFSAGRFDEGIHPTTLANSPNDVRIITAYNEKDIKVGIFNTLHEGGKGLYEQDIDKNLMGTMLAEVSSFGVEEAEARLYENIIGRSHGFWKHFYAQLQETCPEMKAIPMEKFYKSINKVQPSLIRNDADELTYILHIIIRYEVEKDLINNKIQVADLPAIWNKKYKEYLGVEPKSDDEGVLQDIHWAAGYFGFFPSYFMANIISAQFMASIEDQVGSIEELLVNGKLDIIHKWLSENVHSHGAIYSPTELIEKVTGEQLDSKYYINYLRNKYFEVYELNN